MSTISNNPASANNLQSGLGTAATPSSANQPAQGASAAGNLETWLTDPSQGGLITINPPPEYRSMTPQQLAEEVLNHLR